MKNKPLILVSNDDGFRANGVHQLTRLLSEMADVVAICPEGPQSGKSMALTAAEPLRVRPVSDYAAEEPGVEWYAVNGTPVDCVKLAMHTILRNRRPDLVCTGINHGSNAAVNVLYSGTMGAAFEGTLFGIPAAGFSLCDHKADADFGPMLPYVKRIVEKLLKSGLPEGICLNVNAPANCQIKGVKNAVGAKGHWSDEYKPVVNPHGVTEYWLAGKFVNDEPDNPATDDYLLSQGYITVVACAPERSAGVDLPDFES